MPIGSLEVATVSRCFVSGEWLVLTVHVHAEMPRALDVHVVEHRTNRRAALVRLQGTQMASARVERDVLTLCDEHGRLLSLDLGSQAVLVDALL